MTPVPVSEAGGLREHIRARLLEAAEARGIGDDALALAAGVSARTLRRLWAGGAVGLRAAERVGRALEVRW